MKSLLAFILSLSTACASDKFVEANSQVIYNSTSRSQFNVEYRSITKPEDISYVITGGYLLSFLNHQSFYTGIGLRREFAGGYFGAHIAIDYAYIAESGYCQFGPSFEYLSDKLDAKIHYYRPFQFEQTRKWCGVYPSAYADARICYKMKDMKVFAEPSLKIKNPEFGIVCGVTVPFERFNVTLKGGRNDYYRNHFMVCFNFLMFSTTKMQTAHESTDRFRGFRFSVEEAVKKNAYRIYP